MKIDNGSNYLELKIQLETDKNLPSFGDALINIIISSNGYSGKNQVWVLAEELYQFSLALKNLENHRKGEATLNSMSPGELMLRIFAYDHIGHIAIEGATCQKVVGKVNFKHCLEFGFTIEPEQLLYLSKSIHKYTGT